MRLAMIVNATDDAGAVFEVYEIPDDWRPPADWPASDMSAFLPSAEMDPLAMGLMAAGFNAAGGLMELGEGLGG